MKIWTWLAALVVMAAGIAQADPQVDTVVENLDNPTGLAVQPETGDVFVADSGAGRIVRIRDGKAEAVVTDFPKDIYGKGPMYDIGPLGLAFLDKNTLVVGDGSLKDGDELLRVYEVPAAGQPAIKADQMKASFNLPAEGEVKGEGNFYALAVTKQAVYATSNGDDTKGWIAKADLNGTTLSKFRRAIPTKELVERDAPVAITTRTHENKMQLVVGQMGEINVANDALLSFYDENGKLLLNLETGLYDITGLAYSPNGQLFATDFAWMKTEEGGLFQLAREFQNGKQVCKAHKVASLDKPSALAFGKDGTLYITVVGAPKKGKLLKIAPGL